MTFKIWPDPAPREVEMVIENTTDAEIIWEGHVVKPGETLRLPMRAIPEPSNRKPARAGLDWRFNPQPITLFERTDEEMARDTKPFDPSKPLKRIDKIAKF